MRTWILHAVFVVAIVAAVGAHVERALPRPGSSPEPTVTAEHVVVHDGGSSADVTLRVHAGEGGLGPVAVFWLIARPGASQPWEAPHYMARTQTLDGLAPSSMTDLAWNDTQLALPPGRFEITAWLHEILPDGGRRHLAGGGVTQFTVTHPVPTSLQLTDSSFTATSGPLALSSLSVRQDTPSEQLTSVAITVRNTTDAPVAGRVQWMLGHFADSEAFRAAFWRTDWKDVPMLAPGERYTLEWTQRIGLPAATYGLSAWVHVRTDDTWEHSHRSFNAPIKLDDAATTIQRAAPEPDSVHVDAASAEPDRLRLNLERGQGTPARVIARVHPLPEQRRFDWFRTATPAVVIADGDSNELDVAVPGLCQTGSRLARVTLVAEGATRESPPLDDVLVDACA